MISLRYRGDIDGLRAIAVLGVVLYHAFPQNLPGGFSGVDIFFVISGYLISGILYKGHLAGNFSYREFYARRIRRLFPSLITVLLLTLAYGWVMLLPDEFEQMGKHVAAGTVFAQNIVFWKESGYFDTAANLKPLLHLWSLAVEEQFYIIFPLLLVLLWKRPKALVPAMIVLLIASLIGNLVMSYQAPATDFFLTPYRAWEFLGGALLAWWHYDRGHEEEKTREWMSILGAILLGAGFLAVHKGDPYPGWRALMPAAGTLLLIGAGRGAWINRTILSHPAVIWVGLISYPLYLFHWPALSFVHIVKGEKPGDAYLAGALALSLLLATLTYHFIEKRIRHNKASWILPALVAIFIATGLLGAAAWSGWIRARPAPTELALVSMAVADKDMTAGLDALPAPSSVMLDHVGGRGPQTFFLGDSNMQQYLPRVRSLMEHRRGDGRGALLLTAGGVPPIPGVTVFDRPESPSLVDTFRSRIASDHNIDRVVIAARWGMYVNSGRQYIINGASLSEEHGRAEALASFHSMIRNLVASGKKVFVVLQSPSAEILDPKMSYRRDFAGRWSKNPAVLRRTDFLKENGSFLRDVADAARSAGAEVIDPMVSLCEGDVCIREDEEGVPIRYDAAHLRPGYVREHVSYLDQTLAP